MNQTFDVTAGDQGLPTLPEATLDNPPDGTAYWLTAYTVSGLPAGLTMDLNRVVPERVIRGIPVAATSGAVAVTWTATVTAYVDHDNDDDTALQTQTFTNSIAFNVTVKPAVAFPLRLTSDGEAQSFFDSHIVVWDSDNSAWVDSGADGTITFPAATGGHGNLTYSLIDNDSGQPLADVASGITFDTATRKLGGTPATGAQKTWAVTYAAVDTNGGRAAGSTTVYAGGWGVGGL